MNRVALPFVLQSPSSGSAIVGATATITQNVPGAGTLGGGAPAQIYTQQQGGSALPSNQITTDNLGRWTQGATSSYAQYWLPEGTYDIVVSGTGLTAFSMTRELWSGSHAVEEGLVQTALKNSAYTATPQDAIPVDLSTANVPIALPTTPADGTRVQVKVVKVNAITGTYSCTVNCGGTDVLDVTGGQTGVTLTALGSVVTLKYNAAAGIWLLNGPAATLDATGNVPASELGNILTAAMSTSTPASGAVQQNTSGRPLFVNAYAVTTSVGKGGGLSILIGATNAPATVAATTEVGPDSTSTVTPFVCAIVPAGWYWKINATTYDGTIDSNQWKL